MIGSTAVVEKTDNQFPDCFPSNFTQDILPPNIQPGKIAVYRICKYGKIDRKAFLSTFEEVELKLRPPSRNWSKFLEDPSTYSTSCNTDMNEILGVLDSLQGYHPQAFLCEGIADSAFGPVQRTCERKQCSYGHVDWWLFKNCDPSPNFHRVEDL